MNTADYLILAAVAAAVLAGVISIRKNRKKGTGCGCGCAGCANPCGQAGKKG